MHAGALGLNLVKLYRVVDPLFRVEVWATVQFGLRPKPKLSVPGLRFGEGGRGASGEVQSKAQV